MITSRHLIHLAIIHQGDFYRIRQALLNPSFPEHLMYQCAITILDSNYPPSFRELSQPPFVVFYEGHVQLLQQPSIGIVGSRKPSLYARLVLKEGFKHIDQNKLIISGGAQGIDGLAHELALSHNMNTLWVCAHGLNKIYPKEHNKLFNECKTNHLVISEYPLNAPPLPHHFIARNRLVAALSETVLIMSGKVQSGTMHTVNFALELNKSIVTIPHPIDDVYGELCNHLIENGASMLTNVCEFATL